jgi:hypothetical protein
MKTKTTRNETPAERFEAEGRSASTVNRAWREYFAAEDATATA